MNRTCPPLPMIPGRALQQAFDSLSDASPGDIFANMQGRRKRNRPPPAPKEGTQTRRTKRPPAVRILRPDPRLIALGLMRRMWMWRIEEGTDAQESREPQEVQERKVARRERRPRVPGAALLPDERGACEAA